MMQTKPQPRLFNVNKIPGQPKKRKKVTLVFDENKRREFLGGFRKRKLERKRKAQEQLQQQLKEERKKIKQNARERYKKLVSQHSIPELEELLSRKEYDLEDHTVSILELNVADLTKGNGWIGENKVIEEEEEEQDVQNKHSDDDDDDDDKIIGMSLQEKKDLQKETKSINQEMKSSKEVKKEIKKAALNQVKKSKAFQQKQKMEQIKNRKQSRRKLHRIQKVARKRGKRIERRSEH